MTPGPFIQIGTYTIRSGLADLVDTNEPALIAVNVYLDELNDTVSTAAQRRYRPSTPRQQLSDRLVVRGPPEDQL